MNVVLHLARASLLAGCAVAFSLSVITVDATASSLKQRVPLQQKNLHQDVLKPQVPSRAVTSTDPGDEQTRRDEAQLLYNFYRAREGLTHEQALEVLENADFPISHIVSK